MAQALDGGIAGRRQAWTFIRDFAAAWTEPLTEDDATPPAELARAEALLGHPLPAAPREFHEPAGARPAAGAARRGHGWVPFFDRLSPACVEIALSETLFGGDGQLYNACELPAELLGTIPVHSTDGRTYDQEPAPPSPPTTKVS
ncbi:hypothetical protein [Streptomyces sp. NPDC005435]|uniref:hypothetical protein n=1 Tax=Streptomyces sp. NPDC005435 TaxID=3154464 RepID=UPI003456CB70